MNKKIKELYNKAWLKVDPSNPQETFTNAFAELIVRECANLTLDHKSDDYYNGWLDYRDEIKRHFGVEE